MKCNNPILKSNKILFGAHRGDRFNYPENTMPAFKSAIDLGVDVIETDVRTTKDGHLVLIHDRSVERTTNGVGFVDQTTLEELKKLDAGSFKDEKFLNEKIPTVIEFLDYISTTNALINWELKEYPEELGEDWAYTCIDKLIDLIIKYHLEDRSMINSFSQKVLEYVDKKWPAKFMIHGYIGYDYKDVATTPLESFLDWTAIWRKDEDNDVGYKADYEHAKDNDVLTCILVPDTVYHYQKAIDMGCRMFTSDNVTEGLKVLKQLNKR
ncbi:MAG: hypothetical protein J6B16_04085 [Clostridia bacterium]|nr:hypothetical protein [Clostridia bacterium]